MAGIRYAEKSPYTGTKPENVSDVMPTPTRVSNESYETIKANVDKVPAESAKKKGVARDFYEKIFKKKGRQRVAVRDVMFDGTEYIVDINRSAANELSKFGVNVNDAIVLENIDDIVANGRFLESGNYDRHGSKNRNVLRYDYFESFIVINGAPKRVTFDVEVYKRVNNYKTHGKLHEISRECESFSVKNDLLR